MDKVEHRQLEKQVKQDIKGHDKFVTAVDSAWDRIAKHKLLVAGAVGLAIVAGAGVTITSHFSEKRENKAQSELFLAQHELETARQKLTQMAQPPAPKDEKADAKKTKKADAKPPEPRVLSVTEKSTELKSSIEKYEAVIGAHKGTRAAAVAAIEASALLIEIDQSPKAAELLENAWTNRSGGPTLLASLALARAQALEHAGQYEKAISALDQFPKASGIDFLLSEAMMVRAMCQLKLQQPGKAAEVLKELGEKFPETRAGKASKGLLRSVKGGMITGTVRVTAEGPQA